MIRLLALVSLLLAIVPPAVAAPAGAEQEIQYLIGAVETLQGAQFIRNGVAYEAATAASHLRLKRQKAGSRVGSAEEFIRLCASSSSVSGQAYAIRFADGRTVPAGQFFTGKLAQYRKEHGSGG